jgi:hypothetical protein
MAPQNCFDVTRRCAATASISFVIIVLLVFEFRDELSVALRLADTMYAFSIIAYKKTENLPWRSGYMSHYPVFLDCLEWLGPLGGEALCPSSGNNGPVLMDDQEV